MTFRAVPVPVPITRKADTMADTIIVTEPETPPAEPIVIAAEPEPEPEPESTETVATAVGDAIADTVDTIVTANESHEVIQDSRFDEINSRLDSLTAALQAQNAAPEPEPEPVIVEDEIVPDRKHPWFRPLSDWRSHE